MADDDLRREDSARRTAENAGDDDAGGVDAALAVAARHALHDEELIAALATGSLDDVADVERATSLVDRCAACRELHKDLATIGRALRMDASGTIPAPRDFRLSVEDAQRLGGTIVTGRGFLASLRRSMAGFAPSIGASMAALGIVGLLVGSVALGSGTSPAPNSAGTGPTDATSAPAEIQAGAQQTGGPKASGRTGADGPVASPDAGFNGTPQASDSAAAQTNPAVWLLAGSIGLLVAGLALLVMALRRSRASGASNPNA